MLFSKMFNCRLTAAINLLIVICYCLIIHISIASAEEPYEFTVYWSASGTTLTQSKEFSSWSGDVLGITRSDDALFNDLSFSSICIWLHRLDADKMKTTAHCYSKFMDAENDYFIMENMGGSKFLYGTGKFKGITGVGESRSWLSNGMRPIREDTSQGRVLLKGTYELPESQ